MLINKIIISSASLFCPWECYLSAQAISYIVECTPLIILHILVQLSWFIETFWISYWATGRPSCVVTMFSTVKSLLHLQSKSKYPSFLDGLSVWPARLTLPHPLHILPPSLHLCIFPHLPPLQHFPNPFPASPYTFPPSPPLAFTSLSTFLPPFRHFPIACLTSCLVLPFTRCTGTGDNFSSQPYPQLVSLYGHLPTTTATTTTMQV